MAVTDWRTIDVDIYDAESSLNFDLSTLTPNVQPVSQSDVQNSTNQIRQALRGGDAERALRYALEQVPYGADEKGKELYLATMAEILQSIRQSEITQILTKIQQSEGGTELLDVLMKYLYRGMAPTAPQPSKTITPQGTGFSQIQTRLGGGESGGQAMSVLLNWHEKLVEIAGLGSIARVMSDHRTV